MKSFTLKEHKLDIVLNKECFMKIIKYFFLVMMTINFLQGAESALAKKEHGPTSTNLSAQMKPIPGSKVFDNSHIAVCEVFPGKPIFSACSDEGVGTLWTCESGGPLTSIGAINRPEGFGLKELVKGVSFVTVGGIHCGIFECETGLELYRLVSRPRTFAERLANAASVAASSLGTGAVTAVCAVKDRLQSRAATPVTFAQKDEPSANGKKNRRSLELEGIEQEALVNRVWSLEASPGGTILFPTSLVKYVGVDNPHNPGILALRKLEAHPGGEAFSALLHFIGINAAGMCHSFPCSAKWDKLLTSNIGPLLMNVKTIASHNGVIVFGAHKSPQGAVCLGVSADIKNPEPLFLCNDSAPQPERFPLSLMAATAAFLWSQKQESERVGAVASFSKVSEDPIIKRGFEALKKIDGRVLAVSRGGALLVALDSGDGKSSHVKEVCYKGEDFEDGRFILSISKNFTEDVGADRIVKGHEGWYYFGQNFIPAPAMAVSDPEATEFDMRALGNFGDDQEDEEKHQKQEKGIDVFVEKSPLPETTHMSDVANVPFPARADSVNSVSVDLPLSSILPGSHSSIPVEEQQRVEVHEHERDHEEAVVHVEESSVGSCVPYVAAALEGVDDDQSDGLLVTQQKGKGNEREGVLEDEGMSPAKGGGKAKSRKGKK